MDTQHLRRAYADFLEAVRTRQFARSESDGWSPEMVLAHVVVGDRLIAEAAGRVVAGLPASFDNGAALSEPYLHAVIEAAEGWDGLVQSVESGAEELLGLANRMTDEQAATPIASKIVSGDTVVLDHTMPVASLLRSPADVHLRMHRQQLGAAAGEVAGRASVA
jgi:hypothetical protein